MCFVDSEACLAGRKHIALFPILSGPRKAWYVITEAIASEDYAIVQSIWIFDVLLNLPIRRGSWATVGNGRVDRGCSLPFTITIVLLMNVPCRCKRYSVQRTYSIFRINIIPAILWVGERIFIIIYTEGKRDCLQLLCQQWYVYVLLWLRKMHQGILPFWKFIRKKIVLEIHTWVVSWKKKNDCENRKANAMSFFFNICIIKHHNN